MARIRLKALRFEQPKFRKLESLSIEFAERITLIAGHNGIGKSTILGLCANGSGVRDASYQSYLNRAFQANLNEIVHLDFAKDFEEPSNSDVGLPSPTLEYDFDGEALHKRCALTKRMDRREVRVVPRNDPHSPWTSASGIEVGRDKKVPLPTLYLGMTRMLPIGESNPRWINTATDQAINTDDEAFIRQFIRQVIGTDVATDAGITTQSIKGTKKTAKHPKYPYSTKCISLGQDSLSAIATALASFKKLGREWEQYPGGLLVIDEIDAGFHPHAQIQLAEALRSAARSLNLQIIATTHSLAMIEALHPESRALGPEGRHVDTVVYLTDTRRPRVAENYALADIRRDMHLTPPQPTQPIRAPELKLYLEDAEAALVLDKILTRALQRRVKNEVGVKLKPMPLSVGCGNLTGLMKHDPYFKSVVIVVDADANVSGNPKNVVKLPGSKDASGRWRSPEWTLHSYIRELVTNPDAHPEAWAALKEQQLSSDYLQVHLLNSTVNIDNRESAKKWLNSKRELIEQWGIIDLWLSENSDQVNTFEESLIKASRSTAALR